MYRKFTVIGIDDNHRQYFPPEVIDIIRKSKVFSGGKRHHEIMSAYLPSVHIWIDVTVPLSEVFGKYKEYEDITVFASGDPLFYGYATTLQREFPDCGIKVYATFNSLQTLAHRLLLPYQDMKNVSITGRPWKNLYDALIEGTPLIGILTDRNKGPREIAGRMLEYGYDNYEMSVGTALGNDKEEEVATYSLPEACKETFRNPNCVILRMTHTRKRYFGIPESEFHHLAGRDNMITKMPVRLLSLSMLDLYRRQSMWDIGFCTGSVSIEARLRFPHLRISAFETREESDNLMKMNIRRFGAPGIEYAIGNFLELDMEIYPRPDAVFIGGHGGKLKEIVDKINEYLLPDGVIVFNSVSKESCELFVSAIHSINKEITESHTLALDRYNPITILKAR